MIHKGEVGITKAILKTGKNISILNDISGILEEDLTIEKLNKYVTNLPIASARHIKLDQNINKLTDEYYKLYSEMIKDVEKNENQNVNNQILNDSINYKKVKLKNYAYNLIDLISVRNNSHWNTFNFAELNLPIVIKRDSVNRAGYNYDHFCHHVKSYFNEESESILSRIKKPSSSQLKGLTKLMSDDGII